MSQKATKRVFTRKSKLFLILASMILALSCKNPLGDESGGSGGAGGGGSSGGQTITNEQGKVFPAWYLTAEQQQKDFSIGPTILFQSKKNPAQNYRIPAIIVADNGNIIAIGDNRYNHGADVGTGNNKPIDVVYKISKDGGYSWSGEKIILPKSPANAQITTKDNKGDALVFKHTDGTLICMAVSGGGYAGATSDSTRSRILRSVSTDNGENWSHWEEVGNSLIDTIKQKHGRPQAFMASGRGLTLADGTLTAGMTASSPFVFVYAFSKDKGLTWQYGGAIKNAGGHGVINEPKVIAELDDGRLLASVRNASGSGNSQTSITQTKNRMYAIFDKTGSTMPASLSAWSFKCGNVDAEGVVWTRKGEQDITRIVHIQAGPKYRNGLRLYISTDQGQTFPKHYQITASDGAGPHGVGYSSLDVAGDGTIVTLAEEKSKTGVYYDIVFRRYNMKAITGEVYKTEWYKEIKTK